MRSSLQLQRSSIPALEKDNTASVEFKGARLTAFKEEVLAVLHLCPTAAALIENLGTGNSEICNSRTKRRIVTAPPAQTLSQTTLSKESSSDLPPPSSTWTMVMCRSERRFVRKNEG